MKGNQIFRCFLKINLSQKKRSLYWKKCLSHWVTVFKKEQSLSHWVTVFKKKFVLLSHCVKELTVNNCQKLSKRSKTDRTLSLSWFIKLDYRSWVIYPAFCFSWNLCNFNISYIVLMDLGFSLIIMFKKAFLSRPLKLHEFSTWSVRINSRWTKQSTDLATVLHINLKKILTC